MRISSKSILLTVLCVLVFALSANAELTGWWRFDNITNLGFDSSGYANDASVIGNCNFATDAISGSGALELVGGHVNLYSCITGKYEADFIDGTATFAMWIKLDSANPSGFANIGAWCYPSYYPSSSNTLNLKLFLSEGNPIIVNLPANTDLSSWHHFAVTVDALDTSAGYKVYLDGELLGEYPMNGSFGNFLPPQRPLLGAAYDVISNTWSYTFGKIDEVRIYNNVLSQHQIQNLVFNPDFNNDKNIDIADLKVMTSRWLSQCSSPDWCDGADINRDSFVNFDDFVILADNWMKSVQ